MTVWATLSIPVTDEDEARKAIVGMRRASFYAEFEIDQAEQTHSETTRECPIGITLKES